MLNIVQLVLESLIALSLVVLIIPSFGNFFIGFTKLKFSTAAEYVLSWMLGISLISFFSFVTALFLGPVAFQVIGWLSVIVLSYKRNYAFQTVIKLFSHLKKNLVMSLFVFFAALITAGTLMGSWIPLKDGIYIQDGQQQDSLWHIALTKQLLLSVPPVHPSSFTTSVHNYHYFYNILIAVFATTFHIQITTLYYQVFPLIICLLLAVTGAVYAGYPQKKATAFWTVFLTFFCGSFAYLIPVFLPGQQWHDSSFWVSQTFSMMVNPQLLLSYSGVLAVLLVYKVRKKTDNKLLLTLLITGIAAPLIGIKAYAWIFALSAAGLYTLSDLIVDKKRLQTILLGLLTLVICVGVYLVCMGMPKEGAFTFLPLWYLSSMMESPDRLNLPYWRILEDHYRAHHNWLRVAEIQLKELFYFVFGNLGLRSILVAAPVVALVQFVRTKKISFNPHTTILFILLIESMTLPLLFIQKNGPVWNSIQFFYYGLIFGNVLAAGVLGHLYSKIRVRWAQVLCGAVFVAAALPTFITSVPYKYRNYYRIPTATIALLQKNILPTEQIVICPDARAIYDTSLVSALTGARPLLAHPVQIDLMYGETVTKVRESEIKRLFSSVDQIQSAELKQFMADKKIRTALCSKKNNSIAADSLVLFQPSVVQ